MTSISDICFGVGKPWHKIPMFFKLTILVSHHSCLNLFEMYSIYIAEHIITLTHIITVRLRSTREANVLTSVCPTLGWEVCSSLWSHVPSEGGGYPKQDMGTLPEGTLGPDCGNPCPQQDWGCPSPRQDRVTPAPLDRETGRLCTPQAVCLLGRVTVLCAIVCMLILLTKYGIQKIYLSVG